MLTDHLFARKPLILAAAPLLALGMGLGLAHAQSGAPAAPSTNGATAAQAITPLSIRDIYDRLEAAGYRDILEIEWDDGRYEAKAFDAEGRRVKLYVDGVHGDVLRVKRKGTQGSQAHRRVQE